MAKGLKESTTTIQCLTKRVLSIKKQKLLKNNSEEIL